MMSSVSCLALPIHDIPCTCRPPVARPVALHLVILLRKGCLSFSAQAHATDVYATSSKFSSARAVPLTSKTEQHDRCPIASSPGLRRFAPLDHEAVLLDAFASQSFVFVELVLPQVSPLTPPRRWTTPLHPQARGPDPEHLRLVQMLLRPTDDQKLRQVGRGPTEGPPLFVRLVHHRSRRDLLRRPLDLVVSAVRGSRQVTSVLLVCAVVRVLLRDVLLRLPHLAVAMFDYRPQALHSLSRGGHGRHAVLTVLVRQYSVLRVDSLQSPECEVRPILA